MNESQTGMTLRAPERLVPFHNFMEAVAERWRSSTTLRVPAPHAIGLSRRHIEVATLLAIHMAGGRRPVVFRNSGIARWTGRFDAGCLRARRG